MSVRIEGVPEGWELVRLGAPVHGEHYMDAVGNICLNDIEDHVNVHLPIIRRIEPVCTWQHGVFADAWVAEDESGTLWVYSGRPKSDGVVWTCPKDGAAQWINRSLLLNPPVFRADLPWDQRIQQVGPTIEATLPREVNGNGKVRQ